jgi:3'-phosphoadenosine 5'-phosphosulfate sulfotransferase (PAPS reductase)/FAD synthetase
VSISGGKDSIASLLIALETFGVGRVLAHHQIILEDWPQTIEYCQAVCDRLGVPFYMSQARYYGYECLVCGNHYLNARNVQRCPQCTSTSARFLRLVESVLDLVEWRSAWPSLSVRFCTSYFKRENFNHWVRTHRDLVGEHPILVMGERHLESRGRAKLPVLRQRSNLEWITEWRPVLDYRRIDVFRKMRDYGIDPHYCYKAQGMTEYQMYEEEKEGGPRMSCVMCFLKTPEQIRASSHTEQGRAIIERGIEIERKTGHTIRKDLSLAEMVGGNIR